MYDLLRSLDLFPMTVPQLRRLSSCWNDPFLSDSRLQQKLGELRRVGWVRSFPYAVPSDGRPPHYWKLTRLGFQIAFHERTIPRARCFSAIGVAAHQHTRVLSDILVHSFCSLHEHRLNVFDYRRENEWRIRAGSGTVFPDAAFRVRVGDRSFLFCIEADIGSERIQTAKDVAGIERKLRIYDLFQSSMTAYDPGRPIVLFITTRGKQRVRHIQQTAALVMQNPGRTLAYATDLSRFLSEPSPFTASLFVDHRFRCRPLLRNVPVRRNINAKPLAPRCAVC